MSYKTPQALEMALKAAAKASPTDTGRAISGFYFHRLLCRVFSDQNSQFLLKGGQSMLSRIADARATRDIDLLFESENLDAALEELKRLASLDLNDFVTFEFAGASPIKIEDEYRNGLNVRKLLMQTGAANRCRSLHDAEELAADLLDPALEGSARGKTWNPSIAKWEESAPKP